MTNKHIKNKTKNDFVKPLLLVFSVYDIRHKALSHTSWEKLTYYFKQVFWLASAENSLHA